MQPFNIAESAYTATAGQIVFSAGNQYNVAILDNPVREKVNYALIQANVQNYQRLVAL